MEIKTKKITSKISVSERETHIYRDDDGWTMDSTDVYKRQSLYISSYAARSFRIKRSYRPAFLSQKFLCFRISVIQMCIRDRF